MFKAEHLIKRKSTPAQIDSVKVRRKELRVNKKDPDLVRHCEHLWMDLDTVRKQRKRGNRFYDGDQWGDIITVDGQSMTYREYLTSVGNFVIQTNQIKNRVDTIAGLRVKERTEPMCKARDKDEQPYGELVTEGVLANSDINQMSELEQKWIKDACNGGLALAYESYDSTSGPSGRLDSWTQYVNPNRFFFDADGVDPRHWDISIVGVSRYATSEEMCAKFAKKPSDYETLRRIYPNQFMVFKQTKSGDLEEKLDDNSLVFMDTSDPVRCYYIEVWTKESRPKIRLWDTNAGTEEIIDYDDSAYRSAIRKENERRKALALAGGFTEDEVPYITGDGYGNDETEKSGFYVETYWYCRFLAPDGTILWEGESPYADGRHPFTIFTYSYIDGRIIGYNHDAIDHQIAINRKWIMDDWVKRAALKGHIVVPKSIVPADVTNDQFAASLTSIDNVTFVELDESKKDLWPKVLSGPVPTGETARDIALIKDLMDSGSPINGALQGKDPGRNTSGSLYAQMTTNASTPVAAFLEQYRNFIRQILIKKMKNIAKFYDEDRWKKIAGTIDSLTDFSTLNLNNVADIEMDLELMESANSLEAREMQEQDLSNLLIAGIITPDEYMQLSRKSYIQKLRQMRQSRQAEAEDLQQMGAMPTGQVASAGMPPEATDPNIAPGVRLPQPYVDATGTAPAR